MYVNVHLCFIYVHLHICIYKISIHDFKSPMVHDCIFGYKIISFLVIGGRAEHAAILATVGGNLLAVCGLHLNVWSGIKTCLLFAASPEQLLLMSMMVTYSYMWLYTYWQWLVLYEQP